MWNLVSVLLTDPERLYAGLEEMMAEVAMVSCDVNDVYVVRKQL
jgi:hypothetical protein